ncbi:MAG: N-acetyl-gamma-glutamyl-phosphate reductase [Christensenellaceae bacterium]|jgi:N-acetyl-gamma-glutamyl-phosphate reductase
MVNVGIIGATGYTGEELMRLLSKHPEANLRYAVSKTFQGKDIAEVYPNFLGTRETVLQGLDIKRIAQECETVFLCLPHGQAIELVPELLGRGLRVIDLSGDFRYDDPDTYEAWYGVTHTAKDTLQNAVYGLPEYFREDIKHAQLLANPGCYTTTSILAIAPLLKNGLIDENGLVIDAKSGVSGAGRKDGLAYAFSETADNFKAYSVTNHRHTSEIEEQLSKLCQKEVTLLFTPHLLPVKRGILATVYAQLRPGISEDMIAAAYKNAYREEPFAHVLGAGKLPELKYVVGSNNCMIGFDTSERTGRAVVVACIDNLVKGAAGQAIQNFNIMHGFEEKTGLPDVGWYL